ncbi:helix-turn-helix transcriptional regulator [Lentilactobacillus sp. IMAU92037]|uniref:helix-turn-helix transcriptional regulator n=1 Tax=Lentilactobacillus dabitei TaxID=2831523 RepID=UPI001C2CB3AC|nr:helix-turn-helix transcriptional regulator [Lentilactobacillus dabitei]MBV0929882.1 helix-turn-helix transcriptional regulator [Lentilactobacillus dabitei]
MTNNKIAYLRKQHGWTQEHLAEVSQVNPRTIQRLEAGEDASLETLRLVANALGVQIGDLFETISDSDKGEQLRYLTNRRLTKPTHGW